MSAFYQEMADLGAELFEVGGDFGEDITVSRPGATYDPVTRKTIAGTPLTQIIRGTFDTELSPSSQTEALVAKYARVMTASPRATGGFEPGQNDRVTGADGKAFVIKATAHVIKAGIPILWIAGCDGA